eukprot:2741270-Rhodomonas_salina.3
MRGTELAYAQPCVACTNPLPPNTEYNASGHAALCLRPCYTMSGTDIACIPALVLSEVLRQRICLPACYAMPGTEIAQLQA